MKSKLNSNGFTIVELLIATAVFSLVLLGASATIIQISRLYYKGIIFTKTQTSTRNLLDSISRPIQLEKKDVIKRDTAVNIDGKPVKLLCVGTTRITYVENLRKTNTTPVANESVAHSVWIDEVAVPSACADTTIPPPDLTDPNLTGGKDILQESMRVSKLNVNESSVKPGLWNIEILVMYGEQDLMLDTDADGNLDSCKSGYAGSQWCAAASFNTKVFKRISN